MMAPNYDRTLLLKPQHGNIKKKTWVQSILLHGDLTAHNSVRRSYLRLLLSFTGQVYMNDIGNVYWQSSVSHGWM
jgi:hypothetical protein